MERRIKNSIVYFICCLFFSYSSFAVNPDSTDIKREKLLKKAGRQREAVIKHAKEYVGICERTGRNDGKEIERFQRVVGIPMYSPYCAAYVCTIFYDLNIPAPLTGSAASLFRTNVIYTTKDWRHDYVFPKGSVFGLYFSSKGRIAHCGFIEFTDGNRVMAIHANTSLYGSVDINNVWDENIREGDGIARKWLPVDAIYIVADFIGGPLKIYDWRKSGGYVKTKFIDNQ